mgnify:CR=1 FL=1
MKVRMIAFGKEQDYEKEDAQYMALTFLLFSNLQGTQTLIVSERGASGFTSHTKLLEAIRGRFDDQSLIPIGAGNVDEGTNIRWTSIGLRLETPMEFRVPIAQALGVEP